MFQWRIKKHWVVSTYWNNDLDLGFRIFFHLFNKTLDKHAPIKQGIRKDKKIEQKPWVTKGIQTSMKQRDKKEAIKEKDSQKKIQEQAYRKYWNKVMDLLKVSKQTHYKKYFEDNRKNCIYIQRKRKTTFPHLHY